jgi:hypothetical protein
MLLVLEWQAYKMLRMTHSTHFHSPLVRKTLERERAREREREREERIRILEFYL